MAYLTQAEIDEISAQITSKREQLENANNTLRKLLDNEIEDYRFDTTEGTQRAKRVKITDLQQVIDALESQISSLHRKLTSGGLRTVNLRRKGFYRSYGTYRR